MPHGQADNAVSFTFDGPNAVDVNAIQNAINAEAGVTEEPAAPAAKAEPATPPPAENTPTDEPVPAAAAAPAPSQQEELRTFKITVDGQELEVTEADLKAGHMRQRDYTQKTTALARERETLQAERQRWEQERAAVQQELTALDQFLKDQNAIDAYYEKAFGVKRGQPLQPQIDPNKPLSVQDVAEIARYNAEQVRIATQRELAEVRQAALRAQQEAQASQASQQREAVGKQVDQHIETLLARFPTLKKFESIQEDLIADAARFQPKTVEEGKQRLTEAAERRMATIKAIADEEKKQAAAAAAKLQKTSPEPAGGSAPRQSAARNLTLKTEDRKDFLAASEEYLRGLVGQT